MSIQADEFQEIGHCGGQFTVNIETDADGRRGIQFGMKHSRPTPVSVFGVYVLPQGIPVGEIELGGIGTPWNPPPTSDCFPIFIASDTAGMFGHRCPQCKGYWRSIAVTSWKITCPYCGLRAGIHNFLTEGQGKYIKACCELIAQVMNSDKDGEYVVNMDEVADAVGKDWKKPEFYYAEESQQNKYDCPSCDAFNDILGRYGYCSSCGTHNGLYELELEINRIQERIKTSADYDGCVKDAVAAFDSFARQIAKQLAKRIPMTPERRKFWEQRLFHNLKPSAVALKDSFDIHPFKNMNEEEIEFAVLMFHRRHVYEHNGREVDEKYIRDSGDSSVRPKQVIHETAQTALKIVGNVLRMAQNIHGGFHTIFPPEEKPIRFHQAQIKRNQRQSNT